MNSIIKSNGEYITNYFKGKNGQWELSKTESIMKDPMTCLDTFVNRATGAIQTKKREDIYEYAEKGIIFL